MFVFLCVMVPSSSPATTRNRHATSTVILASIVWSSADHGHRVLRRQPLMPMFTSCLVTSARRLMISHVTSAVTWPTSGNILLHATHTPWEWPGCSLITLPSRVFSYRWWWMSWFFKSRHAFHDSYCGRFVFSLKFSVQTPHKACIPSTGRFI